MRRITALMLVALMIASPIGSVDSNAAGAGNVSDENTASASDAPKEDEIEFLDQSLEYITYNHIFL